MLVTQRSAKPFIETQTAMVVMLAMVCASRDGNNKLNSKRSKFIFDQGVK
jgi:hypothetical protein